MFRRKEKGVKTIKVLKTEKKGVTVIHQSIHPKVYICEFVTACGIFV